MQVWGHRQEKNKTKQNFRSHLYVESKRVKYLEAERREVVTTGRKLCRMNKSRDLVSVQPDGCS